MSSPEEGTSMKDVDIVDKLSTSDEDGGNAAVPIPKKKADTRTYEQIAKDNGMRYTVSDVPSLGLSIFLGIQHYLTMLGATVLIPLLTTPAMGATLDQTSEGKSYAPVKNSAKNPDDDVILDLII
jgi:hypothetical protein